MIIYKEISPLQHKLQKLRNRSKRIGFVPTMGALHKGHLSLIKESNRSDDITVCSIFINPTQFNDKRDFEKYPVTIENDIYLLEKEKTEILFTPAVEKIYPEGLNFTSSYNLGYLETILEGYYRPAHFQGSPVSNPSSTPGNRSTSRWLHTHTGNGALEDAQRKGSSG